jgi:hypothetical protein
MRLYIYLQLYTLLLPGQAFVVPSTSRRLCHHENLFSSSQDDSHQSLTTTPPPPDQALAFQQQAQQLRAEALAVEKSLQEERERKLQKQLADVDKWLDHLLVNQTIDEQTQMLNTVEQATQLLQDGRFSQEQVNKMFDRICDTSSMQSRSRCSPLMALLVDAAGKLDEVERENNPNKRWSGRVERHLRKRLFAMDFGFDLENKDPES